MRYFRVKRHGERRLVADDDGVAYDISAVPDGPETLDDLLESGSGRDLDESARVYVPDAPTVDLSDVSVETPVVPSEVWAAGVTYEISEEARQEESDMPDVYVDVYESERPELFLKATPSRTVGPNDAVGIRDDSTWDVPEPELAVVLYRGDVVGFTVGNDVSSRSIEGANPLYLPQAKVYDRCCSLGPCVASTGAIPDPHSLEMTMSIHRDSDIVYEGTTNTDRMVRTCEELASYLTRHNVLPDVTVLLTGTALVPEENCTLREGDRVEIAIEDIGTLENTATTV
jgi:2-dehydro-3-deoxy-D-arabinonate dehydratase